MAKPAAPKTARRQAAPAGRQTGTGQPGPKGKPGPAGRAGHSDQRREPIAKPRLDRARRVLADDERLGQPDRAGQAGSGDAMTAAAHAGHDALRAELLQHTEAGPELTAGDLDARWQDAYAVGDETPGGDNPTPDQDRVDQIGRALGIEYQDDQELMGGDEVIERDKHRWELDPASSDDWPHDK